MGLFFYGRFLRSGGFLLQNYAILCNALLTLIVTKAKHSRRCAKQRNHAQRLFLDL